MRTVKEGSLVIVDLSRVPPFILRSLPYREEIEKAKVLCRVTTAPFRTQQLEIQAFEGVPLLVFDSPIEIETVWETYFKNFGFLGSDISWELTDKFFEGLTDEIF